MGALGLTGPTPTSMPNIVNVPFFSGAVLHRREDEVSSLIGWLVVGVLWNDRAIMLIHFVALGAMLAGRAPA